MANLGGFYVNHQSKYNRTTVKFKYHFESPSFAVYIDTNRLVQPSPQYEFRAASVSCPLCYVWGHSCSACVPLVFRIVPLVFHFVSLVFRYCYAVGHTI